MIRRVCSAEASVCSESILVSFSAWMLLAVVVTTSATGPSRTIRSTVNRPVTSSFTVVS